MAGDKIICAVNWYSTRINHYR